MSSTAPPSNPFFRLVTVAGFLFVVTILAIVAAFFAKPDSPLVEFVDRFGTHLIFWEVIIVLMAGFVALMVDRIQTLRHLNRQREDYQQAAENKASEAAPRGEHRNGDSPDIHAPSTGR